LYPNPADDVLILKTNGVNHDVTNFSILDLTGRIIFSLQEISDAEEILKIDVHTLPSGIYFAQIKTDTQAETVKFVKN
ncbi:MAG: T9SS type A sorting domain-containing protein, partial [Chitinophagales bacterium]|nr:T9SS type A sorting domain-containing protein [Chitinophagales bacterium]